MFDFIQRQIKYTAINSGSYERVKSASWFLKKMQSAHDKSSVGKYWGPGSDLIYYQSEKVSDPIIKAQLNEIAHLMVEKCHSVGIYPSVPIPPFELD